MPDEEKAATVRGFQEIGGSGLTQNNGFISEDYLKKMRSLSSRVKTFKHMQSDPIVGAILFAIEMHLRRATWYVEPAVRDSSKYQTHADFVEECLFEGMVHTFQDFLSEVYSMLPYGFSVHEIVYRKRDDGRIGWRKLPIRGQSSIYKWSFDDNDELEGVYQRKKSNYQQVFIPVDKMLLFRPSSHKGNPEGKSVLRTAYKPYYFKKRLEKIEAIGIERDLSGYPVLNVPNDIFADNDLANEKRAYAEKLVTRIRKDEQMGAVLPPQWELELLSSTGSSTVDTDQVIGRYSLQIAQSLLSDIIMLGHYRAGSYALSEQKYKMFVTALESWLDVIEETLNQYAIKKLMDLNNFDTTQGYPKLRHDPVSKIDPQKLANILFRTMQTNALKPDERLEEYLRNFFGLPPREKGSERTPDTSAEDSRAGEDREDNQTRPAESSGDYDQSTIGHDDY